MRNLIIKWLHEALALKPGEELYLPVDTKAAQKQLHKDFKKEIEILKEIDPLEGSRIHAIPTYKDNRFWLMLKKHETSPLVAFKRGNDGTERVTVASGAERKRRIRLMAEDGMGKEEIEAIEGKLEENELYLLHR